MEQQATNVIPLLPASHPEAEPADPAPGFSAPKAEPAALEDSGGGDLLDRLARHGNRMDRLRREQRRCLAEIGVLRSENRWGDLLALFHPVEDKLPELVEVALDVPVRAELAFALGQVGRFEEAIGLYRQCLEAEPDDFHFHAGLAYTAYNSLYAAKTRQVVLHPAERQARITMAHRHFERAQQLRPEGVTNFYRQGMLFKQIQNKTAEAGPLFETAVAHWEAYSDEQRKERHQERKNYVKALYQLASCELENGRPRRSLELLRRCVEEDLSSGFLSAVHKHYALGKVHFHLGDLQEARQALELAAALADPGSNAYVLELLARVHLAEANPQKASETINRVPPPARRPYIRWTEADILAALGKTEHARRVLRETAERDRRGRHKALLRLTRLEFQQKRYEESLKHAEQADAFFRNTYQNRCYDALFWQAAANLRLDRVDEAGRILEELSLQQPHYPHLGTLRRMLREASGRRSDPQP